MAKTITKTRTFRIGMPAENFSPEYPEFVAKSIKSVAGEQLYSTHGVKTWEDFFRKNPLKLTPAKVYYVYEIGADGGFGQYVTEGQPQAFSAKGLADEYEAEQTDTFYRKENARLKAELTAYFAKQDDLNVIIQERDKEITDLKAATEKWWTTDKIPMIEKIAKLEHQIERIQLDKESTIQALNDQYESEKRENAALEEKQKIEERFAALESEKAERANALAGYGEIASAVAVPLLGKVTDVLLNAINRNYPNLIPSIAEKLGADGTPAQPAQAPQHELDPATAFQTGQGNSQKYVIISNNYPNNYMALQKLNVDVPPKLVALARQIDVEAYSPKERQLKLEELEALADKHIPIRPRSNPIQQSQVYDIHAELVEVLNKYDYTKLAKWKMALAEPLITNWVRKNLKLKK